MKKIEALIKPDKLSGVKDGLARGGYPSLTTYEVKGRGRQSGIVQTLNGHTLYADLLPKTKVEIVAEDEDVEKILQIIIGHGSELQEVRLTLFDSPGSSRGGLA